MIYKRRENKKMIPFKKQLEELELEDFRKDFSPKRQINNNLRYRKTPITRFLTPQKGTNHIKLLLSKAQKLTKNTSFRPLTPHLPHISSSPKFTLTPHLEGVFVSKRHLNSPTRLMASRSRRIFLITNQIQSPFTLTQ